MIPQLAEQERNCSECKWPESAVGGSFRIQTLNNCLETLSGPTEAALNPVCRLQPVAWSLNSRELSEPSKQVNLLTLTRLSTFQMPAQRHFMIVLGSSGGENEKQC